MWTLHNYIYANRYEASPDKGKKGYEERFLDYLEKLVRDLDRRIQRGKERLDRSAEANKKVIDIVYIDRVWIFGRY